jgi:hypothetical protein
MSDSGLDDPLTHPERAALPLAMARQPLWAVGRWIALLDDESRARRLASRRVGIAERYNRHNRHVRNPAKKFAAPI